MIASCFSYAGFFFYMDDVYVFICEFNSVLMNLFYMLIDGNNLWIRLGIEDLEKRH